MLLFNGRNIENVKNGCVAVYYLDCMEKSFSVQNNLPYIDLYWFLILETGF